MLRSHDLSIRCFLWRPVAVVLGLLWAWAAFAAEAPAIERTVLTNAVQVRALKPEQASQMLPVMLRGVITYADPDWTLWFLQDSTAGVYLYHKAEGRLEAGQEVEISGHTISSSGKSVVSSAQVKVLGRAPMPAPRVRNIEELASGRYAGQWVELEELVRFVEVSNGRCFLKLGRTGRFTAHIRTGPGVPAPTDWVEATVRVRGVCGARFDDQNRKIGYTIYSPGLDQVQVVVPGEGDAFTRPALPIAELGKSTNRFSAHQRVKVEGVVTTKAWDRHLIVQDDSGGITAHTVRQTSLEPGDQVELVGFPAMLSGFVSLLDAEARRVGAGSLPEPVVVKASEVARLRHESELVQVRGRLLQRLVLADRLLLVLREGDVFFRAALESTNATAMLTELREGSLLALTGVWSADLSEHKPPIRFQMVLSSPSSVLLVSGPPWWTVPRALAVLGVVAALFVAWLGLSTKREAALKEQYRQLFENASDMIYTHDLEGNFTTLNPAGEQLTGWSHAEKAKLTVAKLVPPDQREVLQAAIDRISKNGFNGSLELEIVTRQGERKSIEATARLIRRKGKAVAVEGIARDVTLRKRAEEEVRKSREELRLLAARLQLVREEERTRMARDVHDELGQLLTGLKMDISGITSRLPPGDAALLERAQTMSGLIDTSIQTVRKIAADLRPGILDNLGLVAALEWQAEDFQKRTGIDCDFTGKLDDSELDPELCTALFRIFQETLTNVARHAKATKVAVTLSESEGQAYLAVKDNGQGFDEQRVNGRPSLGLLGMKERALAFGGELAIAGAPGQGTTVTVRVPLSSAAPARV